MPGDDDADVGFAEPGEGGGLEGFGGFELEVDEVAAGLGGFEQDVELVDVGAGELAAVGVAAAGWRWAVTSVWPARELLEPGQGERGLVEVVEAELEEGVSLAATAALSSISAAVWPMMAAQTLPMRERRWMLELGNGSSQVYRVTASIAVSYRASGYDATETCEGAEDIWIRREREGRRTWRVDWADGDRAGESGRGGSSMGGCGMGSARAAGVAPRCMGRGN